MSKGNIRIDASMAISWSHCPRKLWYDYNPPKDFEFKEDPFDKLVIEEGLKHEKRVLATFPSYVEAKSVEHTQELIKNNTPVIYQPVLENKELNIYGRPDFLIRTSSGEYQVADAKLALSLSRHNEIKLQLGTYLKLLNSKLPALAYLGNLNVEEVDDKILKKTEEFIQAARTILTANTAPDTHFGDSKCKICPYKALCREQFEAKEEITLCYGIDSRSRAGLHSQGITSLSKLANSDPNQISDVPYLKGLEKINKAVLQAKSYLTGKVIQVAPLKLPKGTYVHFDVESNPLGDINSVYLWGWLEPPYTNDSFKYTWSDGSPESDKTAWLSFLDKLEKNCANSDLQ